ncbi:MAG: HEAT repeat domain-containing protein, partial [Actinomycetota bacterium]|nr:HEAT repeat domain-containing protein [Actinomycetota bacterium]
MSESTRALLRRLYHSWAATAPSLTEEEEARQIEQIGKARELASVPPLVNFLYGRTPVLAETAATAIERIVDACGPLQLSQLDAMVRDVSEWRAPPITAKDVLPLSFGRVGTLGVLSSHVSGYVREAGVHALAGVQDGRELPFLLIRLNDWVQPVREAAKHAVAGRIRLEYAAHFVRCLPLVDRLQNQSREDHKRVCEAILRLLRSADARPALRSGIASPDRRTRRLAFRLLVETPADDQLMVLQDASVSHDTVVRLWAARVLRQRLEGQALCDVLERLAKDRFMP